jgi:squalene-associated FAD-dependent desaturase
MISPKVYVVGAGLSGLSAAVNLAARGVRVELIEGATQAGGRCRSYFDPTLGHTIDNGNHFVLSGNHATMSYLKAIGSEQALVGPERSGVPFVDVRSGERWAIAPDEGPIPLWMFDEKRRVPGTHASDYLALMKLLAVRRDRRIDEVISCRGRLWDLLVEPFFIGALNTDPKGASALLAAALVRATFAKGGRAYRIRIAHPTLAAAFVDPAIAFLTQKGASIRFGQRVRNLVMNDKSAAALVVPDGTIPLAKEDVVVLATPAWVTPELLPGTLAPTAFSAIVNAHFMVVPPKGSPLMLGVIGGTAQWIFSFEDRVSVTISAADAIVDHDREALAQSIWQDVVKALALSGPIPPWQIVKERRATFAATPEQAAKRAPARTSWANVFLAGDWTDTGLPATIEGSVRSGAKAAELALRHLAAVA